MKCPKKDPSFFNKNLKKIMTLQNIITTPPPPHTPSVFLVYSWYMQTLKKGSIGRKWLLSLN